MPRGITFTAMLFCMGLAALFVGGGEIYQDVRWYLGGSDALMELANPEKKIKLQVGGWDVHCIDVKYVGSSGDIVVPQKCLSGEIARRLVNGDRVPITYLKSDPNQVLFSREELSIPWVWLLTGLAAMLAGFYSKKLLHRDA